jgi:G:T-mismatch repair DNA endonuclease (very short patch repair protein)
VPKLAGNRERDARKDAELESAGYRVFVVRDCDFESKLEEQALRHYEEMEKGRRGARP